MGNTDVTPSALRKRLLQWRNPDGGWGYYPGKRSRLEATCWSILALDGNPPNAAATLVDWPMHGGLLLEQAGGIPNFGFNGLALLTLLTRGHGNDEQTRSLLIAVQQVKGVAAGQSPISRQDNSLQGWSWVADTFSWVEPTACCLLALKRYERQTGRPIDGERVRVAERMLEDRMCRSGGWNYGNSNMLGSELHPYVPTTALALLALQDRSKAEWVGRSVEWLATHALSERSSLALALATLALDLHGRPTDVVRDALIDSLPVALDLRQLATLAVATYAVTSSAFAEFVL